MSLSYPRSSSNQGNALLLLLFLFIKKTEIKKETKERTYATPLPHNLAVKGGFPSHRLLMIDIRRYGSNYRILTWIPKQAVNGDDSQNYHHKHGCHCTYKAWMSSQASWKFSVISFLFILLIFNIKFFLLKKLKFELTRRI